MVGGCFRMRNCLQLTPTHVCTSSNINKQTMAKLLQRFSRPFFNAHRVFPLLTGRHPFCSERFSEGEKNIINILKKNFPSASHIEVADISGGCGAMYEVFIESEDFRGKNTLTQHRLVNKALAAEIKDMHGLRISTQAPQAEN